MRRKVLLYTPFIAITICFIVGCATLPPGDMVYNTEPIPMEKLEGTWAGYGESKHTTAVTTCSIKLPIGTFKYA